MLAVLSSDEEVIVCEVGTNGKPKGINPYFKKGTGRCKDDFHQSFVEGPVIIRNRGLTADAERELTS